MALSGRYPCFRLMEISSKVGTVYNVREKRKVASMKFLRREERMGSGSQGKERAPGAELSSFETEGR